MSKKADLRVEPYTNEFGQTINPGDEVIYVGTSWKTTSVNRGKFAGIYYNKVGYGVDVGKIVQSAVKVEGIPAKRFVWDDFKNKTWHYEEYLRHARLELKRVYKIETPLETLIGKTI